MRLFSYKDRPVHMGSYPVERLARSGELADLDGVPEHKQILFEQPNIPHSIINAMAEYQAMMDAIRDGLVNKVPAECPTDPTERAEHLKSFGYFSDASGVACCSVTKQMFLDSSYRNSGIDALADALKTRQTKTLAAGIDMIMAELRESMEAAPPSIDHHTHAIVFLYEFPRDPSENEAGVEWIMDAQAHRAALRSAETAVVIGNYLRLLGYEARVHSGSTAELDLNKLAVASGLVSLEMINGEARLVHPYVGENFGLAAISTTFELASDEPLKPIKSQPKFHTHGPAWMLGKGFAKNAFNRKPFAKRRYVDGAYPFEKLKRVDNPTTFIDEERVARVPKRADLFARAQFGDMGKNAQENAAGGKYAAKAAPSLAQRRLLGAFVLLQDAVEAEQISQTTCDHQRNADNIKATCYWLGVDAVGLSRCPDWTYYSHNALGEEIIPYNKNAISMIIDQGHETMEGASGDDWISVAQSMRAYLRFSLLGGVIANQIRTLGYSARVHSVMDGEVLQPPLLLLSGLGEVSRIGEVILNPYLGPRLKSGVVTTDMPFEYDKPVDFGLQNFCENCNKCARECPSGAITAGPKLMFNGYEIWKSDSQKCATYRITTDGGAMCGRCMKTCPWNLEGLFAETPFRWAAMNMPALAKPLAALDDKVGNGDLNPVKKWWWDLERSDDGGYRPTQKQVNARGLQPELDLKYEDQTLAVYPAPLAPHPYPFPDPMDREKGIEAYQAMITAEVYKLKIEEGNIDEFAHRYAVPEGDAPVIRVEITKIEKMTPDITKYEFSSLDGSPLPVFEAGAHIDIVVAPEYLRQYSISGDPADRSKYQIAVLREDEGKGGSKLIHRIFQEGRKIFVSKPINHFLLEETATKTLLMGGGIGVTPMISMAHRLHALGADFELHYSCKNREVAGFLDDLKQVDWNENVYLHFSNQGTRVELDSLLKSPGDHHYVYTCGPDRYMDAVIATAENSGWPEEQVRREYFSVPELPEFENFEFKIKLASSGQIVEVGAHEAPTDALQRAGVAVDVKCSDGLCGVCKCSLISGEVEHRDFVLSNAQRKENIILCQSRALEENGLIEVDL